MKLMSVCNAGIYVESCGHGLLIDGLESGAASFLPTPRICLEEILSKTGEFRALKTFAFTHDHPDHYDEKMLALQNADERDIILPWKSTADQVFRTGPYTIRTGMIPHMPFPGLLERNYSMLIETEEGCIYVAGDSECLPEMHSALIGDRRIDHCFINHTYLAHEEGLKWLIDLDPSCLYLYHVPEAPNDGIRKKAVSVFQKHENYFRKLILIDSYPMLLYNR